MANPQTHTTDADELPRPRYTPPVPWLAKLADPVIAVDTAQAFEELEGWITRGAGGRSVWCIDRINGKWKVGLSAMVREGDPGAHERLTAGEDRELRGAIRNAIMIAKFAGHS